MQSLKFLIALVAVTALTQGCTALKRFSCEGVDRDSWQKPERVLEALDIRPGAEIADLGAGGGYFTFRLADAVGPQGSVYAVDVDDEMLAYISDRSAREARRNVDAVLALPDDPRLPRDGVDLIFISNTYHHIQDRPTYFARVRRSLREGGRIAIIDFNRESWLPWISGHWTPSDVIREEMEAAGYRLVQTHEFLPCQSFMVFAKTRD